LRCLHLFHLDCVEHLLMDNRPPARRPHKSPAHTVKDHWKRPQRRVPCLDAEALKGAAHHTADQGDVNNFVTSVFR